MKIRLLILALVAVGLAFTPFRQSIEQSLAGKPAKLEKSFTKPAKFNSRKVLLSPVYGGVK